MYYQAEIDLSYRFSSSVIFPNGRQSELRKTESLKIQKGSKGVSLISLLGFSEESLNANAPSDFDEIIAMLGKSIYPIVLEVDEANGIKSILNFVEIKCRWQDCTNNLLRHQYENAYYVERYINTSSENLRNEEILLQALKRNTFIQLFFWNGQENDSDFTVTGFPHKEDCVVLCFTKQVVEEGSEVYRSSAIKNGRNGATLNGNAVLRVRRTEDSFVKSASIAVRVEVEGEGYYTKRANIELIEQ